MTTFLGYFRKMQPLNTFLGFMRPFKTFEFENPVLQQQFERAGYVISV